LVKTLARDHKRIPPKVTKKVVIVEQSQSDEVLLRLLDEQSVRLQAEMEQRENRSEE
jgi:hypothetical protein